ncbi:MAG: sugar ABC transporter ATP-binding protein [Candidatus Omnitrophota bacterium]|nr:MAG: sugar ABC transporter ATP-binding protein [Candidatus Omnitrophota bacterium]
MPEVRLEKITKIFDKNIVGLKDFNLQVKDKEFVTILGPSGSGKSTALRIIAGLERQDKGEVFIDGINVSRIPPQERNIAFVFQSYALYPHMNVYENIAVGLRIKGYSQNEIKTRVQEVAELLEISDLLKRKPKTLSGGQRQRVALARAIAKRPKVFLLDEPLSNLDAILRERMRTELKLLFKRISGTVIYVTHDQAEAISLSDKIALIDKGRLRQLGSTDELYYQPKDLFVASFLGTPPINTFEVTIKEGNFVFGPYSFKIPEKYWPKIKNISKLILGIRPEDIKVYLKPEPSSFVCNISTVEKMSGYAILNLNCQNKTLKAVVERDFITSIRGENLWIKFNEDKLYLFNRDTQQLL